MSRHSSTIEALKQVAEAKTRMFDEGATPELRQRLGEACAWLKHNNPGVWAQCTKGKHVHLHRVSWAINRLEEDA